MEQDNDIEYTRKIQHLLNLIKAMWLNLWISLVEGNLGNSVWTFESVSSPGLTVSSVSLLQLFYLPSSDSHSEHNTLMPTSDVSD